MRTFARLGHVRLAGLLLLSLLPGILPAPGAAANERWCPPQTAFCSENAFLDFWQAVDAASNGSALAVLGYPIDATRRAPDGLIVQFYERAVMEWHPENPIEYQVLLARVAASLAEDRPLTRQPAVPCTVDCA